MTQKGILKTKIKVSAINYEQGVIDEKRDLNQTELNFCGKLSFLQADVWKLEQRRKTPNCIDAISIVGGQGELQSTRNLGFLLTLFKPGGQIMPSIFITGCPPGFYNLTASLLTVYKRIIVQTDKMTQKNYFT